MEIEYNIQILQNKLASQNGLKMISGNEMQINAALKYKGNISTNDSHETSRIIKNWVRTESSNGPNC